MIFQFFLILTLSSVKVFASSEEDQTEGVNLEDVWNKHNQNTKDAINYLNIVDSLLVDDLFTVELQKISVGVIEIIRNEYTTVLKKIWELGKMDTSALKLDFNDDQVNNDKKAKDTLTQVDKKWDSNNVSKFKDYLSDKIKDHPKEIYLTSAVLYRFAKFLPDDRNDKQSEDGIFFKLRKNFGGLFGDQMMGKRDTETTPDQNVTFLNSVIKLSTIKNNPQSEKDELNEISSLLVKFKEEVKEENNKIEEKVKLQGKVAAQNEAVVEAQSESVAAEGQSKAVAEAQQKAVVDAQQKAVTAAEELEKKEAEVVLAQEKVDAAATSVLKKLNDVWVKLEKTDTPPSEVILKEYVKHVKLQDVYRKWFSSLIGTPTFKDITGLDKSKPTGILEHLVGNVIIST